MTPIAVLLGVNVRMLRKKLGLTQEALSAASAISRATIAQIEVGESNVKINSLALLASALGTSPASLIEEGSSTEFLANWMVVQGRLDCK